MKRSRWGLRAALTSAGILAYASALPASAQVSIKVLSNRADLISGGDALVEVALLSTLSVNPVYIPALLKATVDSAPLPVGTLALRSGWTDLWIAHGSKERGNVLAVCTPAGGAKITIAAAGVDATLTA